MKFTIRGGTTKTLDVCRSCANLFRRVDDRGERRFCTQQWDHPELLRSPVSECSEFEEKYSTSLNDLRKIAWILRTDKGGKSIGFSRYDDLSEKEQEKIDELQEP